MAKRERSKIPAEKLNELICQVPDPLTDEGIPAAINELRASMDHINKIASVNKTEIETLKTENQDLRLKNNTLKAEVDLLKVHARECNQHRLDNPRNGQPPPLPTNPTNGEIKRLTDEIEEMQDEINAI